MTASDRYRQGLPTSFRIHLALMALAAVPAYLAAASVRTVTAQHPLGDSLLTAPGLAPLLDAFTPIVTSGWATGSIVGAFFAAFITLALTPWLMMSWCCAMHPASASASEPDDDPSGETRPRSPWREGGRYYGSAFLSSLMLAPLVLGALVWVIVIPLILESADFGLGPTTTVLLAGGPAAGLCVVWGALHDLIRAGLVHGDGVWATARRALHGPRSQRLAAYCIWSGLALVAALAANAAAFLVDGPGVLDSALAVCLGQGLLFGRTLIRARWLASAVHTMSPNPQT